VAVLSSLLFFIIFIIVRTRSCVRVRRDLEKSTQPICDKVASLGRYIETHRREPPARRSQDYVNDTVRGTSHRIAGDSPGSTGPWPRRTHSRVVHAYLNAAARRNVLWIIILYISIFLHVIWKYVYDLSADRRVNRKIRDMYLCTLRVRGYNKMTCSDMIYIFYTRAFVLWVRGDSFRFL